MLMPFKLTAAVLLAICALPAMANTDFDDRPTSDLSLGSPATGRLLSLAEREVGGNLARTMALVAPDAFANDGVRRLQDGSSPAPAPVRQSTPAQRNPLSSSLRGDSDLFLWNLVAIVRAQQVDRSFDLVETGLTVFSPAPGAVSAVPLPGALWLLGAGLVAFAASARRRLVPGLSHRPSLSLSAA